MAQPLVKPQYKTEKDLSPAPLLDKLKAFVSDKSTAGVLRDQKKKNDAAIAASGG
jgi:hypothetical protein